MARMIFGHPFNTHLDVCQKDGQQKFQWAALLNSTSMIWLLMLGCLIIAKRIFHVSIYDHEDLEVFMCVTFNDLVTTLKDRHGYVRNSRLVKRQPFI